MSSTGSWQPSSRCREFHAGDEDHTPAGSQSVSSGCFGNTGILCQSLQTQHHNRQSVHSETLHYIHLTALFPGLPGWASIRNIKPILILRKQETVSGSGISWAICKSAPRSRQPRQHPTTQLIQAGCPSWHPTDSVKALESVHSKKLQYNMIQDTILTCAQKLT